MAGRGPAPSAQRQRRNAPQRGDWVTLEPLAAPVLPELAEFVLPDAQPWPLTSVMLWDAWRDDPVTATWNASDRAFAVDTIHLHAEAATAKANELRLRMESLGLTPKGRRDLRFLLPDEVVPDEDADLPADAAEAARRPRPEAV